MTRPKLFLDDPKIIRDHLRKCRDLASAYFSAENELVNCLREVDERRWHVRAGYNSLTYYCIGGLRISRAQTQRLVTAVRRHRQSPAAEGVTPFPEVERRDGAHSDASDGHSDTIAEIRTFSEMTRYTNVQLREKG